MACFACWGIGPRLVPNVCTGASYGIMLTLIACMWPDGSGPRQCQNFLLAGHLRHVNCGEPAASAGQRRGVRRQLMALRFREEHTGCGQPELGRDPAERTKTEEKEESRSRQARQSRDEYESQGRKRRK